MDFRSTNPSAILYPFYIYSGQSSIKCFNSFIFSAIEPVKKEKSKTSFKFNVGPIHFISEIATFHVRRLKRLKTRE